MTRAPLNTTLCVQDVSTKTFTDVILEATPEECETLAHRHGVVEIRALNANLRAKASSGRRKLRIEGRVILSLVQECVVSLEKFDDTLEIQFTRKFEEGSETPISLDEVDVDLDSEDPPDLLANGCVDLAEVIAEEVGLSLDPYPRAPGATLGSLPKDEEIGEKETPRSPFAVLAALKEKENGKKG